MNFAKIRNSTEFSVQVYFEPGGGNYAISRTGNKILDIVHNGTDIAIVDSSTEAHMLDLLTYRQNAKMEAQAVLNTSCRAFLPCRRRLRHLSV